LKTRPNFAPCLPLPPRGAPFPSGGPAFDFPSPQKRGGRGGGFWSPPPPRGGGPPFFFLGHGQKKNVGLSKIFFCLLPRSGILKWTGPLGVQDHPLGRGPRPPRKYFAPSGSFIGNGPQRLRGRCAQKKKRRIGNQKPKTRHFPSGFIPNGPPHKMQSAQHPPWNGGPAPENLHLLWGFPPRPKKKQGPPTAAPNSPPFGRGFGPPIFIFGNGAKRVGFFNGFVFPGPSRSQRGASIHSRANCRGVKKRPPLLKKRKKKKNNEKLIVLPPSPPTPQKKGKTERPPPPPPPRRPNGPGEGFFFSGGTDPLAPPHGPPPARNYPFQIPRTATRRNIFCFWGKENGGPKNKEGLGVGNRPPALGQTNPGLPRIIPFFRGKKGGSVFSPESKRIFFPFFPGFGLYHSENPWGACRPPRFLGGAPHEKEMPARRRDHGEPETQKPPQIKGGKKKIKLNDPQPRPFFFPFFFLDPRPPFWARLKKRPLVFFELCYPPEKKFFLRAPHAPH